MDAVGSHAFWGFSPALDLLEITRTALGHALPLAKRGIGSATPGLVPDSSVGGPAADDPVRVLLLQPGDARHVLKTVAQRRLRADTVPLHVRMGLNESLNTVKCTALLQLYVHESQPEALARLLLLIAVAADVSVPLRHRAAMWLELFGNTKVQVLGGASVMVRIALADENKSIIQGHLSLYHNLIVISASYS